MREREEGQEVPPLDPEELKQRFIDELAEVIERDIIGPTTQPVHVTIGDLGDMFLRAGIPVTNGRFEDGTFVFDVIEPRGEG